MFTFTPLFAFGAFATAQYAAGRTPGAKFIGFDRDGHVLLGHNETVDLEIIMLLNTNL
jgi:hypothetical protein